MQYQAMTYTATIYCGLKQGYKGKYAILDDALDVVQEYSAKVAIGATVTPTHFVYRGEQEQGVMVGLCNYPPNPTSSTKLEAQAKELAKLLQKALKQVRVSIVFPDHTLVLEDKENAE
jgi:hypothetical protein